MTWTKPTMLPLLAGCLLAVPLSGCATTNITRATFLVKDENGQPVEGVNIRARLMRDASEGITDEAGEYVYTDIGICLLGDGKKELSAWARKPGYYDSLSGYTWFGCSIAGRSEPWNPVIEIPMKRIINQQPMLTSWIPVFPVMEMDIGYDVLVGDWLPPYGVGVVTDMIFRAAMEHGVKQKHVMPYRYDLQLIFPNPGDGLLMYQDYGTLRYQKGSEFRGFHRAPPGPYTNVVHWWASYGMPGDGSENSGGKQVGNLSRGDEGKNNMVFRLRTTTNEAGEVTGLYGKMEDLSMSGEESTGRFRLSGRYYVNETLSDNLEQMPTPVGNIHLRQIVGPGVYSEEEAQRRGLNTLGRYTGKSLR